jgi:hypothetical protein
MHNPIERSDSQVQACIERLRSLPTEAPLPYNWQEFQRRSQRRLPAANEGLNGRRMAVAAALLLVVSAIAIWGRVGGGGPHLAAESGAVEEGSAGWTQGPGSAGDSAPARAGANDVAADDVAAVTVNRSRAIESWLATLPSEPTVIRVGTRAAVASLEDRIAQVDDLMTSVRMDGMRPDRLAALQQERLRLVGSLAQVRYAEVVASESP